MPRHGDLILLVSPKSKRYLRRLEAGQDFHTNDGVIQEDALLGAEYGDVLTTHLGRAYRLLRPSLYDLVKGVKRKTQIIYPKEIGYIVMRLGIGPGVRVIEAGSGSGSLTLALSWFCGEHGRVYTYEQRPEFAELCRRNLDWAGLGQNVEQHDRDIAQGFDQTGVDALFLDVRTPWDYLDQAAAALAPGAPIGFLLPTTNQVCDLLEALERKPFAGMEVMEILLRRHKAVYERFRPEDRMVAHTGYLVFARQQTGAEHASELPPKPERPAPEPEADDGPDAAEPAPADQ
jgi:tRNA (adenine57-N1/adenine58-N1)-methyltransferase